MKYLIIQANTIDALAAKVNDVLDLGWEPQGGIATEVCWNDNRVYFQAMIKK